LASNDLWGNWVTPDLARNPGLAADTYNSKNLTAVAPLLSYVSKGVSAQDAINDHIEGNGTQSFWAKIGAKTASGLEILGKPLKEIQRDYKFIHSVYTDHGFLPGFAVTLGVIGGTVGGTLLGGPTGGAIGADLAATALRKLSTVGPWADTYKDSYAKSNSEDYVVSPGRDISNAISQTVKAIGYEPAIRAFGVTDHPVDPNASIISKIGTGLSSPASIISAIGDASFDITTDPIMVISRYNQLMKSGKLLKEGTTELKYPIMATVPGARDFILARTKVPVTSDQMDMVFKGTGIFNATSRTYNRALEDIASTIRNASTKGEAAGIIIQKYPQLGTATAGRLALETKTAEDVHQFLKTSIFLGETNGAIAGQAILPSRTLLRAAIGDSKIVDAVRNANIPRLIPDVLNPGKYIDNPEYNANVVNKAKRIVGSAYKTFSGYMPYSVDPETLKLSLSKFRWNAPDAATTVYRIGRIGLGDRAAKIWAGKYAEAVATGDQALARDMKNQSLFESFKALGLPDDNALVKSVLDDIYKIDQEQVGTQIYGTNVLGEPLGQYATATGSSIGAIFSHQATNMFDIPDFMQIKKAMRSLGTYGKVLGPVDDFVAKAYTNSIFKPLALATAGFGLRVAAAEMIPAFARYGIINSFKAKLAASAAKANYKLDAAEAQHIFDVSMTGLGVGEGIAEDALKTGFPTFKKARTAGLNFAAKLLPEEQMDLATRLVMANNGHILSEGVTTGHGYDASASYQMGQSAHYYFQVQRNTPLFKEMPEWTTYTAADTSRYSAVLTTNLNKAANDQAGKNIASDLLTEIKINEKRLADKGNLKGVNPNIVSSGFYTTEEFQSLRTNLVNKEYIRMLDTKNGTYDGYKKELDTLTRWKNGDLHQFAVDRVDSILGMLVGKDGTYLEKLAANVALGKEADYKSVIEMTKNTRMSMPAAVAGPLLESLIPKNPLVYITNLGFKKVIDPIVNNLAREQLYVMHVGDAYAQLKPKIAAGWMTEDQALRVAQTRATYSMLPQIHNTALRSQFAQIARNFLPFYFAQEQALKRAFNTLKDTSIASPAFSRGMRFYQITEHALSDPTFVQQDESGNKYIYFPLVGEFGKALQSGLASIGVPMVAGLPITARGSLVSLKSVLPELQTPGVSPFLAVSGNLISDLFPATTSAVKGTIGTIAFDRSVWDSLIPAAWLKTVLAQNEGLDFTNQMGNAVSGALAAAYYHGQVPGPDSNEYQRQAFVERIKNNARSILLMKAILNITSPLAPQVKQEDTGLRDEFWKLYKQKGDFSSALMEFLGKHGDSAVSYTVAKSTSNVPGAKYPYIQKTVDFINNNATAFDPKSPVSTGMFYLIPQDNAKNESDRAIYNELVNMHLRSQRTPQELLKQFYISQGDQVISAEKTKHVAAITQAKANFDTYSQKVENDRWSGVMKKMQNLYPIWYADYTNGEGKINAQIAYNQLQNIFSNDATAPKHEQAQLVKAVMKDYQTHLQTVNQYKMLSITGTLPQIENQNWENYLLSLAESDPRLKPVINSVFMKLG